jgi:hypothetical protein
MSKEYTLEDLIEFIEQLKDGSSGSLNQFEAIYLLAKEIQKLKKP